MKEDSSRKSGAVWFLAIVGAVVLGLWMAWGLWFVPYVLGGWTDSGQFGDSFGALNALFAGLAFAGVVSALFLQMQELRLQREELALTRKELAEQGKILRGRLELETVQAIQGAQPRLLFAGSRAEQSAPDRRHKVKFVNDGAKVTKARFVPLGNFSLPSHVFEVIDTDKNFSLVFDWNEDGFPGPLRFSFDYLDGLGELGTQLYVYDSRAVSKISLVLEDRDDESPGGEPDSF